MQRRQVNFLSKMHRRVRRRDGCLQEFGCRCLNRKDGGEMCRQLGDEDECPASGQSSLRYLRLCRLCAVVSTSEELMEGVCMAFLSSEYGWLVGCDATAFRRVRRMCKEGACRESGAAAWSLLEWLAALAQAMCVGMFSLFTAKWWGRKESFGRVVQEAL